MHLKRLELLGYKTFATRTEFLFGAGVTAIVGPNGSGKSNIADAVRWVLGEQSFSLLRAKRSEDMIFAGSERRARLGMAEATITLDNSGQWLPVEFSEVAITRRCYRSGENEYLLNGNQVRLRDISDLLAKSGLARRTYTVIGQGLVDAALSLRPQERRNLIEEAAGLTLYQSRRADALNKLEETTHNVLRARDLIAEISPRLGRLQRQAERAREHALVSQELESTLRVWYGYQWKRGQDELHRRRAIDRYQLGRLNAQHERARDLGEQIVQLRAQQGDLRHQLSAWHRESSALHAQSEALQRDLAVLEERRRLLSSRREEVAAEIVPLEVSREAQVEQTSAVEADLVALSEMLNRQQAAVEEAQAALDAQRKQLTELATAQAAAQGDLVALRTQIADRESRLVQLDERRRQVQDERQSHQAACHSLEDEIDALRAERAQAEGRQQTVDAAVNELEAQRTQVEMAIVAAQERLDDLHRRRNELEGRLGRLQERYALLTRMRREGTGLYDGVRNVMRLARSAESDDRRLHGIVGTVVELIQVPHELEIAVEVALAGQLQDVVVESWHDARAAIDHLKGTRGGRATFLPLDTLRPAPPLRLPQIAGIVGLASDLISCESRLRPVVNHLLGRTIVCQDLSIARRVLDALRGSYQIVTPEGELVRSSGAVTGGTTKQTQGGGILAREREWRQLPARLGDLEKERETLEGLIKNVDAEAESYQDQVATLVERQAELEATRRDTEQACMRLDQEIERAQRERDWHRSLMAESERVLGELREQEAELQQGMVGLESQMDSLKARLSDLKAQIDRRDDGELNARLAERRAQVSLTRQLVAGKRAECQGYQRSLHQIEGQIAHRERRLAALAEELTHTEGRIVELRQQENALRVEIQAYADRIEPAEQELLDLEEQQVQMERQENQARARLQALESQYSRVKLQVARQEDHMDSLRQQIEGDLGLVELDMGEELSGQPLLPLGPLVSSLPEVGVLPEGLEEQIQALKRRLRHLEPVNPDAPTEYAEAHQRHAFLSTQARDLERAIADLKQVIAELDTVMEREFRRAFDAVAHEFRAYFQRLFGGGSARLELTDPDDLMSTGIDIIARPPGKRQQGLALLSGGERALTAAALIFAVLTSSPTPFCVLDEVDAALDEANVGRFRAILRSLAQETQFVIITHNRYTIEIADIVYGISMNADGTSCVISHRLNQSETETWDEP